MATLKEKLREHYKFLLQYFLRVITIFTQLGCGIWATTLTAFYNEEQVNVWAYVIFTIYLAFTLWLLFDLALLTRMSYIRIFLQSEQITDNFPTIFNGSYWFSFVVTGCFITLLSWYNNNVLLSRTSMNFPYAFFAPTWLGLRLFWQSPFWLIPAGLFIPWIDLGIGFAITVWAAFTNESQSQGATHVWFGYGIFGAQCVFSVWLIFTHIKVIRSGLKNESSVRKISIHPVVIWGAIGTTISFCLVAFHNVVLLGNENTLRNEVFRNAYFLFIIEQVVLPIFALVPKDPEKVNEENENPNANANANANAPAPPPVPV
ncbi:unnamed protein product [Orchesella dallaii]|uniref:Uncharacterized protein n=1 Tax=Orchesella dallaii TaxID=48710 RepID=A0ABP1RV13_9HEXA